MAAKIYYLQGDATVPQAAGATIIAHICNDIGGWGAGFVLAISRRWPGPEEEYRRWYRDGKHPMASGEFTLGEMQLVPVDRQVQVANMIAQRGIKTGSDGPPIRYEALERCLEKVAGRARDLSASVHLPRIGCGLAGGGWEQVEPIIRRTLSDHAVAVYVYDYAGA